MYTNFSIIIYIDFGLKYTIDLEGYTLTEGANYLVLVQSVEECDGADGLDTTEPPRRRLEATEAESDETDQESIEEGDGISEDDSNEFDAGLYYM